MAEFRYLLDTNICIYILADLNSPAAQRLSREDSGSVAISTIAHAELERGLVDVDAGARAAADALYAAAPLLDFDREAARVCATIPFRHARFDRLIAAHALALGVTLVTNNEADFADIPGLKTENWTR
ncbi:type II toxin-antitoxin system VapC family toxin [Sphingomonas sp.]|uniref:type II toxin-antitoxin system VapC family toxin n=1 Tax=Sphingomonas sp. TaxID=28214 RepID=UPI001EC1BBEE|nr:type II toxin-antitoxin system VapC family toxin [Sphingomonas sp.]MBX3595426.1 type II toxin-antitoxin system VapC family toxin [Sphingomonas sp.]